MFTWPDNLGNLLPPGSPHIQQTFFHPIPSVSTITYIQIDLDIDSLAPTSFLKLHTLLIANCLLDILYSMDALYQTHLLYPHSLSFILINGLTSSSHAMISFSFTPYVVSQQTLLFYLYNVSLSVPTTQVLILSLGLYSFPTVLPATNHNLHIITRLNFPTV